VGGISTAIGESRILIAYGNVPATISAFRAAHSLPPEAGLKAHRHMMNNFAVRSREDGLFGTMRELIA